MDKEKYSLLGDDLADGKEQDCYKIGMELLQVASRSSPLAARYVTALQQFKGDHVHGRSLNAQKRSSVSQVENSYTTANFQDSVNAATTTSYNPALGMDFDFADYDNLFFGSLLPGDSSAGAADM